MPRGGARAGSGQPQKDTQQKAVYLYPEQIAKLKAIAKSKKLTFSGLLQEILSEYLK